MEEKRMKIGIIGAARLAAPWRVGYANAPLVGTRNPKRTIELSRYAADRRTRCAPSLISANNDDRLLTSRDPHPQKDY
ncbi:hypothetical protein M1247_00790 [Mycobacterium sp. 21AC1]|uniref:hypothetical protein n=1 Tax=[Mycobacterium] appelbergii TaxID=2939269 RepID=UPI0029393E66|nr:hypothetical protein [Mycobacterium sp. 21AC1]MDV3123437.1 hypothetical protein [Mycobacterium sp. 21AC1]